MKKQEIIEKLKRRIALNEASKGDIDIILKPNEAQFIIQSFTQEPSAVSTNSIKERIKHFNSINHSHEANRLESALLAIQELLPPTYIEPSNIQPSAVSAEEAKKVFKAKARDSANSLRELLQYSPPLVEDNMYKSMVQMMDLVLILTNDIEYSDIVEARKSNAEAMMETFKYFFECGRNYQNNAEVTFKVAYQEYLNTLTTK